MSVVSMDEEATSISVYVGVMKSLERFVLSDLLSQTPQLDSRMIDAIVKLSIDRFDTSFVFALNKIHWVESVVCMSSLC